MPTVVFLFSNGGFVRRLISHEDHDEGVEAFRGRKDSRRGACHRARGTSYYFPWEWHATLSLSPSERCLSCRLGASVDPAVSIGPTGSLVECLGDYVPGSSSTSGV